MAEYNIFITFIILNIYLPPNILKPLFIFNGLIIFNTYNILFCEIRLR